jgi:hypothetical protein
MERVYIRVVTTSLGNQKLNEELNDQYFLMRGVAGILKK